MKATVVVSTLAWASTAIAAPGLVARPKRAVDPSVRRTGPPQLVDGDFDSLLIDNNTHAEYTSNWAGAVMIGPKPV